MLFLTTLIPSEAIYKKIEKSYEIMQTENSTVPGLFNNYQKDFNADAVELNIMMHDSKNPIDGTLKAKHYGADTQQYFSQLISYMSGRNNQEHEYIQYWHGYRILWKPLLLLFSINGLRIFSLIAMLILFGATEYFMIKDKDYYLSAIYAIASFIFIIPNAAISLEYIPVILITQIATLYAYKSTKTDWVFFAILGISTAFFDFLTAETLTFTIPYFIIFCKKNPKLKEMITYGATWGISYVGTFAYKYALMSLIYKKNYFAEIKNILIEHMGNFNIENKLIVISQNLANAINCSMFANYTFVIISTIILFMILYLIRNPKNDMQVFTQCIILFCIPYARYIVLLKHSLTLSSFTFRAQMISLLIILYLFKNNLISELIKRERKHYVKRKA